MKKTEGSRYEKQEEHADDNHGRYYSSGSLELA